MYVIKKCDNYGHGRNKWYVVHTTPHKDDACAYFKEEYRLLLVCDPNLTSKDIDDMLNSFWRIPTPENYYGSRRVSQYGTTAYSIQESRSVEYQDVPKRPTRTELLDSILN
jgi:hypothetical protein